MSSELGARIKQLRQEKNLTLKEIAERAELSISFISQLEHNKTSATLESFKKISEALNVSPGYFFNSNENTQTKIVKGNTEELNLMKNDFIYKDLKGAMDNPLFLPIFVVLHPGDNPGNNFTHEGQEYLYVLEGVLTVLINDEVFTLVKDDSIFFDSSNPHYWQNNTNEPVKFLCVSAKE